LTYQPYEGKIIYQKNLTDDLAIFRLEPSDKSKILDFKPGQFVPLGVKIEDRVMYRAYSISSPPEERRYYEFYIRWATRPVLGKITSALFALKKNKPIFWRKPAGTFTIEDKKPNGTLETRQMILVSSGTGIAPFISYILHLRKVGSKRKIVLLHGAKNVAELGYKNMLERLASETRDNWNFTYIPTISRSDDPSSKEWTGHVERVGDMLIDIDNHKSELEKKLGKNVTPKNSFFYICGYNNTINRVISFLSPLGFVSNRNKRKDGSFDIKFESYGE
jgi:ferredoxin--NADP+ reductase